MRVVACLVFFLCFLRHLCIFICFFFFCTDTAPPEIYTAQYTLSLHDALPFSLVFRGPPGLMAPQAIYRLEHERDRKSTRLNSSHIEPSRIPSSARKKKID